LLTYLKEIGITYNPDLVIVADANLWTQFSENRSEEFVNKMMRRIWLKNLLRRSAIYHFFVEVKLQRFYYKFRKRFIAIDPENDSLYKEQQNKDPYAFFEESIAQICSFLKENDILGLMIYIPHKMEVLSDRESKILPIKKNLAVTYGLSFIDFTELYKQSPQKLYLDGDPVHANAEGNRVIAEEIFGFLTDELKITNSPSLRRKMTNGVLYD